MDLSDHLRNAIQGDLSALDALKAQPFSETAKAAAQLSGNERTLRKQAVLKVLTYLRSRPESSGIVQAWASFMKRGYISSAGPIRAISIPFEDDGVGEVVSRLEELGDEIDGVISEAELSSLIKAMSA